MMLGRLFNIGIFVILAGLLVFLSLRPIFCAEKKVTADEVVVTQGEEASKPTPELDQEQKKAATPQSIGTVLDEKLILSNALPMLELSP